MDVVQSRETDKAEIGSDAHDAAVAESKMSFEGFPREIEFTDGSGQGDHVLKILCGTIDKVLSH